MIEIGRICIKTAGRDSGKRCVIVDVVDDTFVLIDGETRRKKVNIKHLEPTNKKIDIQKNASHETVVAEFKKLKIDIKPKKAKAKQKTERPRKTRRQKTGQEEKPKQTKKEKKKGIKEDKKKEKPKGTEKENKKEKIEKKTENKK